MRLAATSRAPGISEAEAAQHVWLSLNRAAAAPPQAALPILKGLVKLVKGGDGAHSIEVDEARCSAFMAICEFAKALHRGQPADLLGTDALRAAEKWRALAG